MIVWSIFPGGFVNAVSERKRIGSAFHRQAGEYDRYAKVQKRVVSRLVQLVDSRLEQLPARLLDIGCGTGSLLGELHARYPQASHCGIDLAFNMALKTATRLGPNAMLVNGDAEQLPFKDGTFDLVASSSTFQWAPQLGACFAECCRVLKDGGLLCVAFFGGKTLWELQECYREALAGRFGGDDRRGGRLQRFRDVAEVKRTMTGLGYEQLVITSEMEIDYHADVPDLLRSIKGIGASTTARNDSGGGLGWRGVLSDMADIYRSRFQKDGMLPATYEVIYIVARRAVSC